MRFKPMFQFIKNIEKIESTAKTDFENWLEKQDPAREAIKVLQTWWNQYAKNNDTPAIYLKDTEGNNLLHHIANQKNITFQDDILGEIQNLITRENLFFNTAQNKKNKIVDGLNNEDYTPLFYAVLNNNTSVRKWLIETNNAKGYISAFNAAFESYINLQDEKRDDINFVKKLWNNRAGKNDFKVKLSNDENGNNLLHLMFQTNIEFKQDIIDKIQNLQLQDYNNIYQRNHQGDTPISCAISSKNTSIKNWLKENNDT